MIFQQKNLLTYNIQTDIIRLYTMNQQEKEKLVSRVMEMTIRDGESTVTYEITVTYLDADQQK